MIALFLAPLLILLAGSQAFAALPELPRVYLDTAIPSTAGYTPKTVCAAGCDFTSLNTAVNHASVKSCGCAGVTVTVTAGQTFTETVTLPVHNNSGWVIIQSSQVASLPLGVRVGPSQASLMPKLVGTGSPVVAVKTADLAARYRFVGIEVTATGYTAANDISPLIDLAGTSQDTLSLLPSFIYFDRSYIHADATLGGRRGVALQGKSMAVIDSYLSDWKEVGADSQAIAAWNGPGPFKIVNNYLEGAGENVMFGGATPSVPNNIPSDIEIRRNYFFKPLTWRVGNVTPPYAGTQWNVKNLLEFKNGQRAVIDGNLFENCWPEGQIGWAVLLTPKTEAGAATWIKVVDITFTNNIVRHVSGGVEMLGVDPTQPLPSESQKRVLIRNNLFTDIGGTMGGSGFWLIAEQGLSEVTVEHNTVFQTENIVEFSGSDRPESQMIFRDNIHAHNSYGFHGDGYGVGNQMFYIYDPDIVIEKSVFMDHPQYSNLYPAGNFFVASSSDVGFTDLAGGDYRLTSGSAYHNAATDGTDIGVDFVALNAAMGAASTVIHGTVTITGTVKIQ